MISCEPILLQNPGQWRIAPEAAGNREASA